MIDYVTYAGWSNNVRLANESTSHAEDWHLFRLDSSPPDRGEEDALAAWLEPLVRRAGLTA